MNRPGIVRPFVALATMFIAGSVTAEMSNVVAVILIILVAVGIAAMSVETYVAHTVLWDRAQRVDVRDRRP